MCPESPDFDQIAEQLLRDLPDAFLTRGASVDSAIPSVVEQLRQVWNARGAADMEAVHAVDGELRGQEYDAIAKLDR